MFTLRHLGFASLWAVGSLAYAGASPISIGSCSQLKNLTHLSADYQLSNPIECAGVKFYPLGNFTGTLDGNGHTISNLTIEKNEQDYAGLFTVLGTEQGHSATIKNIHFNNAKIIGAHDTHRG